MEGFAGLSVLNDMKEFFKKEIGINVKTIWKEKSVGMADSGFDEMFIGLDTEDISIYSLMREDEDGNNSYDWLHKVHFFIDIRTGKSEKRVQELVNKVLTLAKKNVIPLGGGTKRIQLLPTGIDSHNQDFINIFRYQLSFTMIVFNP